MKLAVSNNNNKMADTEDDKVAEEKEEEQTTEEEKEPLEDGNVAQVIEEEKLEEKIIEEAEAVIPESTVPTIGEEDEKPQESMPETHDDEEASEKHKEELAEPEKQLADYVKEKLSEFANEKPPEDQDEKEQVEVNDGDEILEPATEFEREETENELSAAEESEVTDKGDDEEEKEEEGMGKEEEDHIVKVDAVRKDTMQGTVEENIPLEDENVIGVPLSREETPDVNDAFTPGPDTLEASSPVPEETEVKEEMIENLELQDDLKTESANFNKRKEELVNQYEDALVRREKLQQQNLMLQNKLVEHFRKKKADEFYDSDKHLMDQEQRYLKQMAQLEDLRKLDVSKRESYRVQIEDIKVRSHERKTKADDERNKLIEFKRSVALRAINAYNCKPVPPKDIDQHIANEFKREDEVVTIRLEYIRLKNKLKKKEQQLKLKEELVEGLHLIDFEQLKIENQTYNEKIEERNEELLKFRKKITSTVQILTHLKEKLQFVQAENLLQRNELKDVEAVLAQTRDILSRTKQARDALRIDNTKLRQKCGFLDNESLLQDFENQKDESSELQSKLDALMMKHTDLTLQCQHVQQKIEQASESHY